MEAKATIFVRVKEYEAVHEIISTIKEKVSDIEQALSRVKEIKTKEDAELASWKSSLQNAKVKIAEIGHGLPDPQ
jgi:chromosome segregation ATPase